MGHIAVIDIGKTNKKILIFDEHLKIVESAFEKFEEFVKDNIHFEAIDDMTAWFKRQLRTFSSRYDIRAISITTHGATALCIDGQGKLAVPPVAYTTEAGEEFREDFFKEFGSKENLQKTTATAEVGSMINIGKVLYFLKKKYPEGFSKISTILNYPQYFGWVFTGKIGAEPTYTGCHTYLFDFANKKYSSVAEKLGVMKKLPANIMQPWDVLGTVQPSVARETGLSESCVITMGIHDSNASLLPYLVKGHKNFVLNSTGTWCVAMSPSKKVDFQKNELGKLVFFNLDAFYKPVKTSIFMGGLEYDAYREILTRINGKEPPDAYDHALYRKIINDRTLFVLPSVARGTGIFPTAVPKVVEDGRTVLYDAMKSGTAMPDSFKDYATARAALVISLAIQTRAAFEMVGFQGTGNVFTEGGFRKNAAYNQLLSALYPNARLLLTGLQEATAFGAAMLAKAALDKTTPYETKDCFEIEMNPVRAEKLEGIEEYAKKFMELI
jgi:sugar (pentulose or hexulose) kinase